MTTKLKRYFTLCPLADQTKLQGVSKHPDPGCVLVTQSRNIVSKYKVSEQRPVSSWSSREGMLGAAIYDCTSGKYACLLANNQLRTWGEDDVKLETLKKFAFKSPIFRLATDSAGGGYVVFDNGGLLPLTEAVEARKQLVGAVIGQGEILRDVCLHTIRGATFGVLTCQGAEGSHMLYIQELGQDSPPRKVLLTNGDLQLSGSAVSAFNNQLCLLSLWSDGQLFSLPLLEDGGEVPGREEGRVEGVQAGQRVAVIPLSPTHVALYGADDNQEGATVLIYNSQFRVVQARQRLKLYSSPPLMWGPFGGDLVFASGRHLLAVTFELGHETLAGMVGAVNKRKVVGEVGRPTWGAAIVADPPPPSPFSSAPESLRRSLDEMTRQGLSEAAMSEALLPALMDKKNVTSLAWFVSNVRDVSESVLARLVSFCLREDEGVFSVLAPEEPAAPLEDLSASLPPESPLGAGRLSLLDAALSVPFNAGRLLPELRRHLAPQDAMLLLRHASARLWHGDPPGTVSEDQMTQLLSWSCVLLDANYQHCLLSMDTQVLHTLTALSDIVDMQIGNIEELRSLEPIIRRMQRGQHLPKPKGEDQVYSIDTVQLY